MMQRGMLIPQPFDFCVEFSLVFLCQEAKHADLFLVVVKPIGEVKREIDRHLEEFFWRVLVANDLVRRCSQQIQPLEYQIMFFNKDFYGFHYLSPLRITGHTNQDADCVFRCLKESLIPHKVRIYQSDSGIKRFP